MRLLSLIMLVLLAPIGCTSTRQHDASGQGASVIFIHPDGASASTWAAARALHVGPDNDLNWDTLPAIAVYRGHMADSLNATSNGGATAHATGVRPESDAFGRYRAGKDAPRLVDRQGKPVSVALQALEAGIPVGLVQTGIASEPGTACFVVDADHRKFHFDIVKKLTRSGCQVMMAGGERYFLPEGVQGRHGKGERKDGLNLIEEAEALGYTVVYDAKELAAVPRGTKKLLGVFAWDATFNAASEEKLAKEGLPLYVPGSPTVGEMTAAALRVLKANGEPFYLVVEEEGTDNFGNNNHASGTLEAARRADEAYGVAQRHLEEYPRTLLVTCADSDGSGLRMIGIVKGEGHAVPAKLAKRERNGAPIDGVGGPGTAPFLAAPDKNGLRLPFYVTWNSHSDVMGGVLVRAQGYNSGRVRGSMHNTDVAELMRDTLFGH